MSKVGIKFMRGGKVFLVDSELELSTGDTVVVESVRGVEIAYVADGNNGISGQEEVKKIIRVATEKDLKTQEELNKQKDKVVSITNDLIAKYKLDMKLVDVSFTLEGAKVVISYVCEDRVDFRELVKDLASSLKLRIELRQIGIRDQAKILGGIGFCGKECCCKQYLNDFDKVGIKMAKTQGLSLNPTKISGICGRLMCCLAYENDFYSEISVKMPKINSRVKTKDGIGTVVYNNLLKQKVTVKIEKDNDTSISEFELKDIEVLPKENIQNPPKKEKKEDPKKQVEDTSKKEKTEDIKNSDKQQKNKFNNFKKKNKNKNEIKK